MFANNTLIEVLDLRFLVNVTDAFANDFSVGMTSLRELYFPANLVNEPTTSTAANRRYINGCTALEKIVLPHTARRVLSNSFVQANLGATLIIGDAEHGSDMVSMAGYMCLTGIGELVLYAETPPYWHNVNENGYKSYQPRVGISLPNGCKIYVPDDAVDTYKNSGNTLWGLFANSIYPISEFDGEL